ncbi:MAG: hypothetical protein ABI995_00900 [Acidobacteriota bacterium]
MIPFARYADVVQEHIEQGYGIRVVVRDVPDPLTGDLDGSEIHIDYAVTPEQRLFLLAHLFGHTVQWNTQPGAVEPGQPRQIPVPESLLPALLAYEKEAAGYAIRMLHDAGITGIDPWLSDYTACDVAYLRHYYVTGEKGSFASFWKGNASLIEPRPIPGFTPKKYAWRTDGIVI